MELLLRAALPLLLLCLLVHRLQGIRWLAIEVSSEDAWNKTNCQEKKHGFAGEQYKICRRSLSVMKYVSEAVEMTAQECQLQMKNRRWNCSTITRAPSFYNDLKRGTRESAYVHSLSSASVAYSVTQACSTGKLEVCGCGRIPKGKLENKLWLWGGCSDNIAYGVRFSKRFTDAVEKKRMRERDPRSTSRALMNLHNNEAGRIAVRDKMELVCRCHGVSGSCHTKTCFRRLSEFKDVATLLKKKYDKTIHVVSRTKGHDTRVLRPRRGKRYTQKDLIALDPSPNYCKKSKERGTLGTTGRKCNPVTSGKGSCAYMCCGRGYKTVDLEIEERCKCEYVWCCYVECQMCKKTIRVSMCN